MTHPIYSKICLKEISVDWSYPPSTSVSKMHCLKYTDRQVTIWTPCICILSCLKESKVIFALDPLKRLDIKSTYNLFFNN